jgi:hypothetical protein
MSPATEPSAAVPPPVNDSLSHNTHMCHIMPQRANLLLRSAVLSLHDDQIASC